MAALAAAERAAGLARPPHRPRPGDRRRGRLPSPGRRSPRRPATGPLAALADDERGRGAGPAAGARRHRRRAGPRGATTQALRARQHAELDDRADAARGRRPSASGPQLAEAEAERERARRRGRGAGRRRRPGGRARAACSGPPATGSRCSTPPSTTSPAPRRSAPRHADLRAAALDRRSELLDLRQRRLDGMAAELARCAVRRRPVPGLRRPRTPLSRNGGRPGAARRHRRGRAPARRRRGAAAIARGRDRVAAHPRRHPARRPRRRRPRDPRAGGGRGHGRADGRSGRRRRAGRGGRPAPSSSAETVEAHRTSVAGTVARLEAVAAALDDLAAAEAGAARPRRGPARRARRVPLRLAGPGRARAGRAGRSPSSPRAVAELAGCRGPAGLGDQPTSTPRSRPPASTTPTPPARPCSAPPTWPGCGPPSPPTSRTPPRPAPSPRTPTSSRPWPPTRPTSPALQAADRAAREALLATAAAQDDAARALRSLERLLPLVDEACAARRAWPPSATPGCASSPTPRAASAPTTPCGCGSTAYVLAARLETVATLANERLARHGRRALPARALRRARRPGRHGPAWACGCSTSGPAGSATPPRCPAASRSWPRWPWPSGSPMPCARRPAASTSARCSSTRASAASTTTASSRCSPCSTGCARAAGPSAWSATWPTCAPASPTRPWCTRARAAAPSRCGWVRGGRAGRLRRPAGIRAQSSNASGDGHEQTRWRSP